MKTMKVENWNKHGADRINWLFYFFSALWNYRAVSEAWNVIYIYLNEKQKSLARNDGVTRRRIFCVEDLCEGPKNIWVRESKTRKKKFKKKLGDHITKIPRVYFISSHTLFFQWEGPYRVYTHTYTSTMIKWMEKHLDMGLSRHKRWMYIQNITWYSDKTSFILAF